MTLTRGLALCAALIAATAPTASAAVVDSHGGFIEVEADPGESSDMVVTWSGRALVAEDRSAPLRAGANCEQAGARRVRCAGRPLRADVELGDRADAFTARAPRRGPYFEFTVDGDAGDDTLTLPYGGDLDGDEGNDRLVIGSSRVRRQSNLLGGDGDDVLKGGESLDALVGGRGDDRAFGGPGRDRIFGGGGRDVLQGGAGADRLDDGDAAGPVDRDKLIGGPGDDGVISYAERARGVVVDLSDRSGDGEPGENDLLRGVEQVRGSGGDDRLVGDDDENKLEGWLGNDVILGRGGDDRLLLFDADRASGGGGDDRITGAGERARVSCGRGEDTLAVSLAGTPEEEPRQGLLVPPACEWVLGRHRLEWLKISAHPRVTSAGTLAFTVAHFRCCEHTLSLTLPESPFSEIDSAPVDYGQVEVDPGGRRGLFRASTLDAGEGNPLVWRFEVDGSG
jgi:Ca2+-binding RTX toxin-like protein